MSAVSFEWVEKVQKAIKELDQKPLFNLPFPFPLDSFSQALSDQFGKEIVLSTKEMRWLEKDHVLSGYGENVQILSVLFTPLKTPLYFVMNDLDLKSLLSNLLEVPKEQVFLEKEVFQEFLLFVGMEALKLIEKTEIVKDLSPKIEKIAHQILDSNSLYFGIDLNITVQTHSSWGQIIIPQSFKEQWNRHVSNFSSLRLEPMVAKKIDVEVSLELGFSELSYQEWSNAQVGDFVILDKCSYDPEVKSGRILMTLNGTPIFRAKIKEEGLKVLEYPLYEEIGVGMGNDFDEDDEDLFGDLDEDDEIDEDFDEDESEESEDNALELKSEKKQTEEQEQIGTLSPEKIPVHLTVEVGRIKMTALELMDMQPGNIIEMNVAPEQGVDLVVNGKKVGRGELVKLGEVLGVRILSF